MIKRILVISLCVCLLICVFVVSASAQGLDYNDFIYDLQVDGDNDLITCSFPVDEFGWGYYGSTYVTGTGNSFTVPLNDSTGTNIECYPLYTISSSDLPDGTVITFFVDYTFTGWLDVTNSYLNPYILYSPSGRTISVSSVSVLGEPFSFSLDKQDDEAFRPYLSLGNMRSSSGSSSVTFTVRYFTMQFSISSLLRLQQSTGKTNAILKEVEQQLADQGQTLDDVLGAQQDTNNKLDGIINDKVDPSLPSGGDIVGDLDDAEGQIRDDAQSGLDQGASVQQSAIQILGQYLSAFACVSWIFDRFSTIPFVSGLLALSFSLGITGSILGIGLSIARSYTGSSRSSRSARSKGG